MGAREREGREMETNMWRLGFIQSPLTDEALFFQKIPNQLMSSASGIQLIIVSVLSTVIHLVQESRNQSS